MLKLKVLGGGREVGRTCLQLDVNGHRFLLDCGISPSLKGRSSLPISPDGEVDGIFVSHAHLDHTGAIPALVRQGFKNKIFMTLPTLALLKLLWEDELSLMKREWPPEDQIWDSKEMQFALAKLTVNLTYHEAYKLDSIQINFHNAGHILGSAMIDFSINDFRILFSGDLGTSSNHLRYWRTEDISYPDVLICEGTYGGKNRKNREDATRELLESIRCTLEQGGKVLIPVFAVGKTQEILKILKDNRNNLPNVNVYLEGMAIEALKVYEQFIIYMDDNIRRSFIFNGLNPFRWESLKIFSSLSERREIYNSKEPCIIMAPSGMLRGGWSVWHMIRISKSKDNLILLLGHMEDGTIGYSLINGLREFKLYDMITKEDVNVKVDCEVKHIDISAHAMHSELCNYISKIKPENLILIHGDYQSLLSLSESIKQYTNNIIIPSNGDVIELSSNQVIINSKDLEIPISNELSMMLPNNMKVKIKHKGIVKYVKGEDLKSIFKSSMKVS
ncbi:MAG: MBL fold metallo-hydrolase [Candidatus Methanomethyliaceae archaeon]|nr:MBL fold metallo-hydrolase [Candidatus Methanomethyliaceae archaeon]MDW7971089.1 MBL fold metallo-hydrolase [Nitrososphaerota archaeon]